MGATGKKRNERSVGRCPNSLAEEAADLTYLIFVTYIHIYIPFGIVQTQRKSITGRRCRFYKEHDDTPPSCTSSTSNNTLDLVDWSMQYKIYTTLIILEPATCPRFPFPASNGCIARIQQASPHPKQKRIKQCRPLPSSPAASRCPSRHISPLQAANPVSAPASAPAPTPTRVVDRATRHSQPAAAAHSHTSRPRPFLARWSEIRRHTHPLATSRSALDKDEPGDARDE
ncbi:hypothetical protein F4802DRAFT_141579 [Xylaria palmicola]|nr:hypothetical protein F4802DRAFT_141579 [Xylaria palmicola]